MHGFPHQGAGLLAPCKVKAKRKAIASPPQCESSAVSSRVLDMHVLPLETFVLSSSAPSTFAAKSKSFWQPYSHCQADVLACGMFLELAAKVLGADDDGTKVSSGKTCISRTREETALDSHWGGGNYG